MLNYRNRRKLIKAVFAIVILIQVLSSCISVQHITLDIYKNSRTKRVEEFKSLSYSFHDGEEKVINPNGDEHELSVFEVFDETTITTILLIIKNLLTLFSKLIIVLSFLHCFLYIRGWIILVSQVKYRFFVMRYLQLVDGKKNQLVFQ